MRHRATGMFEARARMERHVLFAHNTAVVPHQHPHLAYRHRHHRIGLGSADHRLVMVPSNGSSARQGGSG
jgi:hypothetical protein